MSADKLTALPLRTQPTRSHSASHNTRTRTSSVAVPVCPETSEFVPQTQHFKAPHTPYIHTLTIDYGHLQRPAYYYDKASYEKIVKFSDDLQEPLFPSLQALETKRLTGISLLNSQIQGQTNKKQTEKKKKIKNVCLNLNPLDSYQSSQHKQTSITYLQTVLNSTKKPTQKSSTKKAQSRTKLQSVHAYNQTTRSEPTKKKLHSRIVKMVVGGGPTKTRIISYPDSSDYLRLCTLK